VVPEPRRIANCTGRRFRIDSFFFLLPPSLPLGIRSSGGPGVSSDFQHLFSPVPLPWPFPPPPLSPSIPSCRSRRLGDTPPQLQFPSDERLNTEEFRSLPSTWRVPLDVFALPSPFPAAYVRTGACGFSTPFLYPALSNRPSVWLASPYDDCLRDSQLASLR